MLADSIKEINKSINVCIGGSATTFDIDDSFVCDSVDYIIYGEGESTLIELLEAIRINERTMSYKNIKGLYYRDANDMKKNMKRSFIKDLDLLPILNRGLCSLDKFGNQVFVSTSRGCSAKCVFCVASALSGSVYRVRNVKNLYMELLYLNNIIKVRPLRFNFIDDTFTAIPKRVRELADIVRNYGTNVTSFK